MTSKITSLGVLQRLGMVFVAMTMAGLLAACGGGSDAPPAAVAPAAAITPQPTDQSAVAGSTATFSEPQLTPLATSGSAAATAVSALPM